MDFHSRFLMLLSDRGITAYRVAKETGISERLALFWRKGEMTPNLENLIRLSDYFNVSIDYLVGRDDIPNRKELYCE